MKYYRLLSGLVVGALTLVSCSDDHTTDNEKGNTNIVANTNKNNITAGTPREVTRMEFPHITGGPNNPVIVHKVNDEVNFSLEWANLKRAQRWTCYQMYAANQRQTWRRNNWNKIAPWFGDPFQEDPMIEQQYRTTDAHHQGDGYDRGHICPSQDRVDSQESNMQTFYYSNMHPQLNSFNAGVWEHLESRLRSWITKDAPTTDTLYVCKGGIIDGTNGQDFTMSNRKLIVPKHFFCALLMKNAMGYKAIGFWFEHKANNDTKLGKYAVNIQELQRLTKLDFFCNLPDDIEKKVESLDVEKAKIAWGVN